MEKTKIIEEPTEKVLKLTGRRKILFETMRRLHPKGSTKAQYEMCEELHDERIEHYINNVFNKK